MSSEIFTMCPIAAARSNGQLIESKSIRIFRIDGRDFLHGLVQVH